eukprot:6794393-Prymnesium_polylepis.1
MYFNNLVIERHGEWNWPGEGVLSEAEPPGYGRQISFPLDVDSELNDVRPSGSPPLQWYLQLALRWLPGDAGLRPVSHYNIMNPQLPVPWDQSTFEAYFFVPPYVPSVAFYSGHFPSGASWFTGASEQHGRV